MTKPKTGLRTLKPSIRTLGPTIRPAPAPSADYFNLYSHRRWRKRRDEHLQAEPLCRLCWHIDGLYVQATTADHITPHRGDRVAFFEGALCSLCASCHSSRKAKMEHGDDFTMPGPVNPPRTRPLLV